METSLTIVDQTTGLATQEEVAIGTPEFHSVLGKIGVTIGGPLLLQDILLHQFVPKEDHSDIHDLYGQNPVGFGEIVNQILPVYGIGVFEHDGWNDKEQVFHQGYYQVLILVRLDGRIRTVKSSSAFLLKRALYMSRKHGWFRFQDGPINYKFIWKGSGSPHIMERQDLDSLVKDAK
jgi:hypothetical protein